MNSRRIPCSVFLVPAEEEYRWTAELIAELSAKTGTGAFPPHLTVHSGVADPDLLRELLERERMPPIRLRIRRVGATEEFFRSVFLEFEEDRLLRSLHDLLGRYIQREPPKTFLPHLSLLYADLSLQEKEKVARGVILPKQEILFDILMIVQKPQGGWHDLQGWEILHRTPLH